MSETIDLVRDIIIILLLLSGTFFILSASIGVIRFPDVYTRLHAATKASTLGISGIMIGAFIFLYAEKGIISGKLILGIIFILLTAPPLSAHMIGRAAHSSGIKPWAADGKTRDAYADSIEKNK
ncbi:Na(+) H(+) antiporter subunit G [Gracilibacillus boraciitolerans JCM 21714]|uniref:Na(+) H(+) antiporter subunit G n=1 Tax=Gracilibacillus boraciitolerans JCM 21714 TaxID=1298598 RepID=W4VLL4_9BACI|nr:monovalent cation/H(+) antiporter subunit G [Gracilibacillus boraciitolerans]GAE94097.1 Na(+) H(+) antiporter subunit G [Gracilibacillus boraciitolerans JCM 21714]